MSTENRKKGERKILSPIPEEYDITQMEGRLSSLESSVNRFEQDVQNALLATASCMDKVNQLETKTAQLCGGLRNTKKRGKTKKKRNTKRKKTKERKNTKKKHNKKRN